MCVSPFDESAPWIGQAGGIRTRTSGMARRHAAIDATTCGPPIGDRTRTSRFSDRRADYLRYRRWSRCPDSHRDLRRTRAALSLTELLRRLRENTEQTGRPGDKETG